MNFIWAHSKVINKIVCLLVVVGIAGGLALGAAMGLNKFITRFFEPLIEFAHAIPGITWVPIAILWFSIVIKP